MRGLMSAMSDPYAAHANYIRPAGRAPALWRVIVLVAGFELIFALSPDIFTSFLTSQDAVDAYFSGVSAFGTLAQFFTFGISAFGLVVLLRLLHGRGFWSLIGPPVTAWDNLRRVAGIVALVLLAQELLPPWYKLGEAQEVRAVFGWLLLIPVTLLALFVQVGTEEMLFRGYLQQQLAWISDKRWVWMGVPSVMFGVLHYWNGNGPAEGLLWAVWATLLGMACADLTARSGNLGAAIGLHLANNAFALLLYGMIDWPGSGVALFLFPYVDPAGQDYGLHTLLAPETMLYACAHFLSVLVMWLAARIAIRR